MLLGLSYLVNIPRVVDLPFHYWVVIWVGALVLALVATARGSRLWAFAALLPLVTFFTLIALINIREPR